MNLMARRSIILRSQDASTEDAKIFGNGLLIKMVRKYIYEVKVSRVDSHYLGFICIVCSRWLDTVVQLLATDYLESI